MDIWKPKQTPSEKAKAQTIKRITEAKSRQKGVEEAWRQLQDMGYKRPKKAEPKVKIVKVKTRPVGRPRGKTKKKRLTPIGPGTAYPFVRTGYVKVPSRRRTMMDVERERVREFESRPKKRRTISMGDLRRRQREKARFRPTLPISDRPLPEGLSAQQVVDTVEKETRGLSAQQVLDTVEKEERQRRAVDRQIAAGTEELMKEPATELKKVREYDTAAIKESVRRTGSELMRKRDKYGRKHTKQRQMAARKLLGAMGVISGPGSQAGPGRPRGTYKYGMPIHIYKARLREQAIKQKIYQQQRLQALQQRGFTPERVQQMETQRTVQQPRQFEQNVQRRMPVQDEGGYRETPEQIRAVADDELAFRRWAKDRTISPTTRNILLHLMRTQNRARSDDIEMQRRIQERKMIADQSNLMRARNLFGPDSKTFDILEEEGNILQAPNTFRANPDDNILRQKRLGILNTREAGNNLWL